MLWWCVHRIGHCVAVVAKTFDAHKKKLSTYCVGGEKYSTQPSTFLDNNYNNNILLITEVMIKIIKIKVILITINNENSPDMIYVTWYSKAQIWFKSPQHVSCLGTNVFILFSSNYTLRLFTCILKNLTVEKFRSYRCWYIQSPGLPVKCARLFALQLYFTAQILSIFNISICVMPYFKKFTHILNVFY